jgi:hypothetical protein
MWRGTWRLNQSGKFNNNYERSPMRVLKNKRMAAASLAGLLLVGGGIAYAVVTLTGTGGGSGGVTTGTGGTAPVTISVHIATSPALVPGATVSVDFDASNANPNPVTVKTISLVSVTSTNALCQSLLSNYPGQFSLGSDVPLGAYPVPINTTVPANTSNYGLVPSATLSWKNLTSPPVDQSACLGQPLTVTVATP